MRLLDTLLDQITMYRLMLYYLIFLVVAAWRIDILSQTIVLLLTCYLANKLFSRLFGTGSNIESFAITTLILTLIVGPVTLTSNLFMLIPLGVLAMASKYLFAINHRHIFNPAALAVVFFGASWWVTSEKMFWPVLLGGLLILAKTHRLTLAIVFSALFTFTPTLLFFAVVMLLEPRTSPNTLKLQIIYAVLIAILFKFGLSLELALVLGNIFAFVTFGLKTIKLTLVAKQQLNPSVTTFQFKPDSELKYLPGQYLELSLPHKNTDSRGSRRFFTISSSPTENHLAITSKFAPEKGSSFKTALLTADKLQVTGPFGQFTLPTDATKKLVWIAGGIGITPFRSMAKHLSDTKQKRDIVLFYCAKSEEDFVFKNDLKNLKTIYKIDSLTEQDISPYLTRTFYLSGPRAMVTVYEDLLKKLGVPLSRIKTDYFPGY